VPCLVNGLTIEIAGEDDLDALDLAGPAQETDRLRTDSKSGGGNGGEKIGRNRRTSRVNKPDSGSPQRELSAALSASLRTELLREIEGLIMADDAALWAQQRLAAKNQLSAADARQVEGAFAARLGVLPVENAEPSGDAAQRIRGDSYRSALSPQSPRPSFDRPARTLWLETHPLPKAEATAASTTVPER